MLRKKRKYDPLRDYLRLRRESELTLTFAEIEEIIEARLPSSAERSEWWANEKSLSTSHVQREAWRAAGFDAFLIRGSRKVKFVRIS